MHILEIRKYLLVCAAAIIQLAAQAQNISDDPKLVKGQLENGMTYYIRHSETPKGCADFYIVHNVGALQEEDNQNGLAHFLEHMAFNGTKHYPEKGILNFLAKEGVRFGYNINAYTSRKQTVYNLSTVPLVRESFVDSVLTVLHDWSCDITCDQKAIDEERGVISEEWRRRDNLKSRIFEKQANLMYNGSLHTKRNVIGTLEIINNFKREEILDFYHKWYRPDMQAIIVVGDFDPKAMEEKIRNSFSDIPLVENPAPKQEVEIPAIVAPKNINILDKEIQYYTFKVFCRQPYPKQNLRSDEAFYRDLYARQIVTSILSDRMAEDYKKSQAPGKRSVLVTNSQGTDLYVSQFTFVTEDSTDFRAVARYYARTLHRFLQYGISKDEFEAAKLNVFKKNKLNEDLKESDLKTSDFVATYINNFTAGFSAASPAELRKAQQRAMESVSYQMASEYVN
ncbi:MAG: insulinase family protein, partial [Bacteroidales bacterium]|nr:insulinase family protein [Bacteroidales bacterium]